MLRARTGAWRSDYLAAFRRINVGTERHWNLERAAANWEAVREQVCADSDTIVLLGAAVRRATGLFLPNLYVSESVICLPHPSGLNRWYNSERNRRVVELVLEELYLETTSGRVRPSPDPADTVE